MAVAGTFSNYLISALLDEAAGGVPFTPAPTLWIALYSSVPGQNDLGLELDPAGTIEADGTVSNYNRVSHLNNLTNWTATVAGVKSNATPISFPTQTGTMGAVVSVGWRDAPNGGNLYWSFNLNTPIILNAGSSILWAPGNFTLQAVPPS